MTRIATDDRASGAITAEGIASTVESSASTTRRAPEVFLRLITAIHSILSGFVCRRLPMTSIGYAIINSSALFLDIICLWVFHSHLHRFYPVTVTVGYAIAAVYSFPLNRRLNFQAHGRVVQRRTGYVAGIVSQYVISILGLPSLPRWFGVNVKLTRVVLVCCEGIYLYVFIRLWMFRGVPKPKKQPQ